MAKQESAEPSAAGPAGASTGSSLTFTIPNITVSDTPATAESTAKPTATKPSRLQNPNLPLQEFQVFQRSLFEKEYPSQHAFISADLQRMQHGIYEDKDRLYIYGAKNNAINVSFVAITFTFHPTHSTWHRIKRAIISITATETPKCFNNNAKSRSGDTASGPLLGGNIEFKGNVDAYNGSKSSPSSTERLRIVKFAPHLAYGRISNETLHWNFSLNSTIGVTQPFTANVTPATAFDKTKVINSMLKIQGSTRHHDGTPSGKIVWSLEENKDQSSGLPREFTFAFLVERRNVDHDLCLKVAIQPSFTPSISNCWGLLKYKAVDQGYKNLGSEPIGQAFLPTTKPVKAGQPFQQAQVGEIAHSAKIFNFALLANPFDDLLELPGKAVQIRDDSGPLDSGEVSATATATKS